MRSPGIRGALVAAITAAHGMAAAQLESTIPFTTGFIPDPATIEGHARGERPGSELAPHCTGFVGARPSHVLALESRFGFMRIFATGPGDLAIAVRTPDGRWLCSEDRFGPHPSIEGLFLPGRLEIYVGTDTANEESDYVLRVTETRSVRPGVGLDLAPDEGFALARDLGLDVEAEDGLHGEIRLRRGFLPDPRALEGIAGGGIDASGLGGSCRGYVTEQPTHVISLLSELDFFQLIVQNRHVEAAESDTSAAEQEPELTLLVLTPEGRFLCDVAFTDVPEVSADAWGVGTYRVWVGSQREERTAPHRLLITEIRRAR